MLFLGQPYLYVLFYPLVAALANRLLQLAMVAPECSRGYSYCHRHDRACTWQLPLTLQNMTIVRFQKLRQAQAVGHYSNYILLRVVRLTVETNMLTGIYPFDEPLIDIHFIPL
jgi:hypothetical protein